MTPTTPEHATAKRLDAEQAQAQLELKDRALAASTEGITIADARLPDKPLIYVNAGFERLTGYSAGEVLGRNCRFLQGPGTDRAAVDALRTAVVEDRAITVQLLNYRKDGTPFWNRLSITPVRDSSGAVTHFIGVQSDVTEEKAAKDALESANQRLEEASQAMRQDLAAASLLQRDLLPLELPKFAGVQVAFRFRPCSDVGGDALNVLALDDRHVALYILDVAGHGVAAALLSVTLTHLLSMAPERSFLFQPSGEQPGEYRITPPVEVIERLNRHFSTGSAVSRFFTMIYGILDLKSGEFRYVAAGHLGPIHFSKGKGDSGVIGPAGGIPVGLLPAATYEESRLTLAPGDRLYFCTDGVAEAEDSAKREFGVRRLLHLLEAHRGEGLEASLAAVMTAVEAHAAPAGLADDASLLAIKRF